MATKHEVKSLIDQGYTAEEIAEALACTSGYVRETCRRNGWRWRQRAMKPARTALLLRIAIEEWEGVNGAIRYRDAEHWTVQAKNELGMW